jgi:uncharacterized membrane protein YeaQ/YmgE (transglycosylase-associated protein family)
MNFPKSFQEGVLLGIIGAIITLYLTSSFSQAFVVYCAVGIFGTLIMAVLDYVLDRND